MNEFERRALDIAQYSSYLAAYARTSSKIVNVEYFTYNVNTGALNAGLGTQAVIQIQSDSDFVMQYMSAAAVNAGATVDLNANITVQITDTGSGKTLFSNPTILSLVTGNSGFPFLMPAPRVFAPNTNVKFDLINQGAVNYTSVAISLIGARIYYAG